MIGLDTNILVHYLTGGDKEQSQVASTLIEKYTSQSESMFINNIVLCELVWVLSRGYKYKKEQIVYALRRIFSSMEFTFEKPNILWEALDDYERKGMDFSDALISQINKSKGCEETFSFDQGTSEDSHFRLLHS